MTETIYKQDKKFTGRKEAKTIPPIKSQYLLQGGTKNY